LSGDRHCDVVVVGAGITGALVSDALTDAGLSVIAVDQRHPAHGSTSASTALLQYELDVPLNELMENVGPQRALATYHAAAEGVRLIGRISSESSAATTVGAIHLVSIDSDPPDEPTSSVATEKKHLESITDELS
jgi:glycine/D-amino acid oxidase-like deaminating enzyme